MRTEWSSRPVYPVSRVLGGVGVALATMLILLGGAMMRHMGQQGDFLAFYSAGVALLRGTNLYDFEQFHAWQVAWVGSFDGTYRYVYLPSFAATYLPLASLPLPLARAAWLGLMATFLLAAARISGRWLPLPLVARIVGVLAFFGTYATFVVAQNSALTLALWAVLALALWRGSPDVKTGVVAALLLYKPQILLPLLVLWLWRGWWRGLLGFMLGGLGVLIGSLLIAPGALQVYVGLQRWALASTTTHRANAAVLAELMNRLPAAIATPLATGLGIAVLALLVAVWGRHRAPTPYHHAMLWLTPLLVSPYVANYDLLLLLLPLSFVARVLTGDRLLQAITVMVWVAPLVNLVAGDVVLLTTWASLALFLVCAWRAYQLRHLHGASA